jgi:hypothetical protein
LACPRVDSHHNVHHFQEEKESMKSMFIILGGMIIAFAVIVVLTSRTQVNTTLSDRAKEFIKQQRDTNNSYWQQSSVGKEVSAAPNQADLSVGPCFRIHIPFPLKYNKLEGECLANLTTLSPDGGRIITYANKTNANSVDDDTGVKLRRSQKDEYTENREITGGKTFVTFQKKDGGYEKSAFYIYNGRLFVLNLIINGNPSVEYDQKFKEMLTSVEFLQ